MRYQIHKLLRPAPGETMSISYYYDVFISFIVLLSTTPLLVRTPNRIFSTVDTVTVYILFLDYLLRWLTADYRAGQEGKALPFIVYPVRLIPILTMLSLLPSLGVVNQTWRVLRLFRICTLLYYSKHFSIITTVFKKQKRAFTAVITVAFLYIYISALVVFSCEPDLFPDFFSAVYWAVSALTTVGFANAAIDSVAGRIICMVSSLLGILVVALPTAIFASGFMEELYERERLKESGKNPDEDESWYLDPTAYVRKLKDKYSGEYGREAVHRRGVILSIMVGCILLDFAGYMFCDITGLPFWLDMTGTVLASVLIDPAAGFLVGFIYNFVFAVTTEIQNVLFVFVSAAAAVIPAVMIRKKKGGFNYRMFIPAYLLTALTASGIGLLIYEIFKEFITPGGAELPLCSIYEEAGIMTHAALFLAVLTVKLAELLVSFLIVLGICLVIDKKTVKRPT